MDTQAFARVCQKSRFNLLPKQFTPMGNILLAERYFNQHPASLPEINGPHWQTLWTIERAEAEIGQKLFFRFGVPLETRIAAASIAAKQFMADRLYSESHEGQADARRQ